MRLLLQALLLSLAFAQPVVAKVLAEVNGTKITQQDFNQFKKHIGKNSKGNLPSDEQILDELIKRELMYQEALKNKVDKNPDVSYVLEQQRRTIIIQSHVKLSGIATIPEDELKELYHQIVASQSRKEFKIKHIMVKTEDEAKQVIVELEGGAQFEELAKQKSIDPSSRQGGEIGWLSTAQLKGMPEMLSMLEAMKKGNYSKTAVKTEHGWHVVKLDDIRVASAPSYTQMRPQLNSILQNKRLDAYIDNLKANSEIKINK